MLSVPRPEHPTEQGRSEYGDFNRIDAEGVFGRPSRREEFHQKIVIYFDLYLARIVRLTPVTSTSILKFESYQAALSSL